MPDTFHPFFRLPTELRLAIWEYILPKSRVINVYACKHLDCNTGALIPPSPFYIPLAGVNCEARHLVAKHYKLYPGDLKDPSRYPPFFFNGDTDIVHWIPDTFPLVGEYFEDEISETLADWFFPTDISDCSQTSEDSDYTPYRENKDIKQLCLLEVSSYICSTKRMVVHALGSASCHLKMRICLVTGSRV